MIDEGKLLDGSCLRRVAERNLLNESLNKSFSRKDDVENASKLLRKS